MPRAWTSPSGAGHDLALDLDLDLDLKYDAGPGRRAALERALRAAIRSGRLRPGAVVPSSRALAVDLGVARGTVTAAYEQLVAEGWLVTRPGAATAVADTARSPVAVVTTPAEPRTPRHDLHPGLPDLASFPRQAWAAAVRQVLRTAPDAALAYGDERGDAGLRVALVEHLGRARGVVARPEHVVVCNGFVQGLALLATVLRQHGARAVAMEDPCLLTHRQIVQAAGLQVVPVPVDGHGVRTNLLPAGVAAAVVTPAHQFPLGVPLARERRAELLAWAAAHDALVIEDDYDGELRYDRKPLGAVQGLAPERVVYAGTASKALAPGLRLGWLVVPPWLVADVVTAKGLADRGTSSLDQLTLAELVRNGTFGRHVRRQRARYRARRDHLLDVLGREVPGLRVYGVAAGLRVLLELPPGSPDEAEVVAAAAERGIRIIPMAPLWHGAAPPPRTIVVGYGAPPDHGFRAAVDQLAAVLRDLAHSASASPRGEEGGASTKGHSSSATRRQSAVARRSPSTA